MKPPTLIVFSGWNLTTGETEWNWQIIVRGHFLITGERPCTTERGARRIAINTMKKLNLRLPIQQTLTKSET